MPQPKQDEYHSLKEQIAQLEKKKKERGKGKGHCVHVSVVNFAKM